MADRWNKNGSRDFSNETSVRIIYFWRVAVLLKISNFLDKK